VKSRYSIKDLEQLSGIKAHTLRAWEQRYKLINPKRTSTNIRFYEDEDLKKVLNASVLLEAGFKIGEVAKMEVDFMARKALECSSYDGIYLHEINELKISTLEFNGPKFESTLTSCVEKYGVHVTFQEVIGAFIEEIGKLWLAGSVSISQEHFISSLIRQKIFSAIDGLKAQPKEDAKQIVLFLPANELHEIGLLYLAFVLKERGELVYYLGQSLPKEYLTDLLIQHPVDCLVSSFTNYPEQAQMEEYLLELDDLGEKHSISIHLTGYQLTQFNSITKYRHIAIYESLKALASKI
jgi:DNA-binding transcriptional MerR regulator